MSFKSFREEFPEYEPEEEKKSVSIGAFLPILGLVLAIALGAIAFVLSEPATQLLRDNLDDIPAADEVQYVVGGMIFLMLLMLSGMIYAMFAPKPQKRVTEQDLKKERTMKEREKLAAKKRKHALNRKAAEELKRRNQ